MPVFHRVYRWSGTHLDEENRNVIIEASAVSTFPFQESVIIVVAVNASSNQKVFQVKFLLGDECRHKKLSIFGVTFEKLTFNS